jgi:biopolymer transport protein ExbB/TolQ
LDTYLKPAVWFLRLTPSFSPASLPSLWNVRFTFWDGLILTPALFWSRLRNYWRRTTLTGQKKLCDATSAPIARVAKAGLNRMHRGEAAVAQAMEEAMMDVTPEVKTRIGALWSLANIATLTGLVGTVIGLINTFQAMRTTEDPAQRINELSKGIEEAMYNTAYGLGIALICMLAHLLLSTASKKVMADLESFTMRFENMLADGHPGGGSSRAPGAPVSLEMAWDSEKQEPSAGGE